jgi:hypothetical protein
VETSAAGDAPALREPLAASRESDGNGAEASAGEAHVRASAQRSARCELCGVSVASLTRLARAASRRSPPPRATTTCSSS